MKELLNTFNIEQILLFIVILAAAIKGVVVWIDWAKEKIGQLTTKREEKKDLQKKIEDLIKSQQEMEHEVESCQLQVKETINRLERSIKLLMDSDKDDIKAWITQQHHYFCYELGYIDDYNLDCLERRFSHYEKEGGNSFAHDLMNDIRALPIKNDYFVKKINKGAGPDL